MSELIERLRHWANGRPRCASASASGTRRSRQCGEDRDPDVGGLIPKDEAEATRRLQRARGNSAQELAELTDEEILLPWWSFFWLHPGLHPDDAKVWPAEVSDALPLATEACRRYEAGQITDGEYYPVEVVRDRIKQARAKSSRQQHLPPEPKADTSET